MARLFRKSVRSQACVFESKIAIVILTLVVFILSTKIKNE